MTFYRPYPWSLYTKKLQQKIDHPRFVGFFSDLQASKEGVGGGLRLVVVKQEALALYWLVDETDGVIADIRYQVIGPSALIGALEAACQLLLRKNYEQARRISTDLIDREVRDLPHVEAFPIQFYGYLNLVLEAIEAAVVQCMDIPLNEAELISPLASHMLGEGSIEEWEKLSKKEKLSIIEQVMETEIRPYIELDAGGIQIIDLSEKHELMIAYQGSCTSCPSATGSTLSAIQRILESKVYHAIQVIPALNDFSHR